MTTIWLYTADVSDLHPLGISYINKGLRISESVLIWLQKNPKLKTTTTTKKQRSELCKVLKYNSKYIYIYIIKITIALP